MGISGGTQIIGGKSYEMYSPEWYAAQDANKVHNAAVSGQAAGTGQATQKLAQVDTLKDSGYPASIQALNMGSGGGSSVGGTGLAGGGGGGAMDEQAAQARIDRALKAEQDSRSGLIADMPRALAAAGGGDMSTSLTYGGGSGSGAGSLKDAQDAQFARAKDQAGQIAKSALTALRDAHGQAGGGGGLESFRTAQSVIAPAEGMLGDINREQLIQANNAAAHAADQQFQGNLAMRGQNMGLTSSLMALLKGSGAGTLY